MSVLCKKAVIIIGLWEISKFERLEVIGNKIWDSVAQLVEHLPPDRSGCLVMGSSPSGVSIFLPLRYSLFLSFLFSV